MWLGGVVSEAGATMLWFTKEALLWRPCPRRGPLCFTAVTFSAFHGSVDPIEHRLRRLPLSQSLLQKLMAVGRAFSVFYA